LTQNRHYTEFGRGAKKRPILAEKITGKGPPKTRCFSYDISCSVSKMCYGKFGDEPGKAPSSL